MTLIDDTCDGCGGRFDPMGDPHLTKRPEIGPYAVFCWSCQRKATTPERGRDGLREHPMVASVKGTLNDVKSYEIGYRDGESSAHADWFIALDDFMPEGVEPTPTNVTDWLAAHVAQAKAEALREAADYDGSGFYTAPPAWVRDWLRDRADARVDLDARPPNRRGERDVRPWQPKDGDTRCQSCGAPNIVWYTDHELWNLVIPGGGVLCIACFVERAEHHLGTGVAWALWHEAVPFSDDFRRGLSAGMAIRTQAAEAERDEARAERDALRDAGAELLALKDGPRGADYERRKPLAWGALRIALAALADPEAS